MERSGRLKKTITLLLMLVLVAVSAFIAGCGNDDGGKTIEDEGRRITVDEREEGESGKVTVEGEQGEATIEVQEEDVTEEALGVPFYPGAEFVPGSGLSSTTASGEKESTFIGAEFVTGDPIQKVVDWYTAALGETDEDTPEVKVWGFQDQEGFMHLVKAEMDGGRVKITIFKMGGNVDIEL